MALPLDKSIEFPKEDADIAQKVIEDANIVLPQIIPNLTVSLKKLETSVLNDGQIAVKIQLMSLKNNKEIPLRYESDGIKKIISILHLLIAIYNQDSITVAIDELDSGVFEYLLGEILRIVAEEGKGQLIFTSHNLRPLEVLDRCFIAFTTTNPKKRYIRPQGVDDVENLRDFYFRDIILGEQPEETYDMTNNADISFAFRKAGINRGA